MFRGVETRDNLRTERAHRVCASSGGLLVFREAGVWEGGLSRAFNGTGCWRFTSLSSRVEEGSFEAKLPNFPNPRHQSARAVAGAPAWITTTSSLRSGTERTFRLRLSYCSRWARYSAWVCARKWCGRARCRS
eukprot:scaffold92962_cov78-Phaeocystis_antarctica.AAC.2